VKGALGEAFRALGLYRRTVVRLVSDPRARRNWREVQADLVRTRRDVGRWAHRGGERAQPERQLAILSFTNLPLHAKLHCAIAKMMQLRGYTPIVLTYSGCRFAHRYFRLFGIDRLVMWDEYMRDGGSPEREAREVAESLFPVDPTITGIRDLSFRGVDVGKHALSVTCRRRVEGRLELDDRSVREDLRAALREAVASVLVAERFLTEHPVQKMLVRDAGYIPNGSLFEAALRRAVDCVVYDQGQRRGTWVFKRYTHETKGQHFFSLAPSTWAGVRSLPWDAADQARLDREFAGRYQPESVDDTRRLMSGKRPKSPDEVRQELRLDPRKRTAVVFSHVAWDAAFFFGTCLFEDFEEWLFETVRFAAEEGRHLNWIVKLHPFNAFKLRREDRQEESEMRLLRRLMPLPDHVRIVRADTDLSTESLFPVVDYVLTVNGTVGMEFPCFGVPAILAGTGRYDGFGFTLNPATREEYFALLKRLETVPPLDARTRTLARRHFLTLMTRRQVSLEDALPMELRRINEAQSDVHDNIAFTARSLEDFQATPSLSRLTDWFTSSADPDLLGPQA
jgi:hypothetical protein